jgi:hypothetical protein
VFPLQDNFCETGFQILKVLSQKLGLNPGETPKYIIEMEIVSGALAKAVEALVLPTLVTLASNLAQLGKHQKSATKLAPKV